MYTTRNPSRPSITHPATPISPKTDEPNKISFDIYCTTRARRQESKHALASCILALLKGKTASDASEVAQAICFRLTLLKVVRSLPDISLTL
jgi:hypothetical protein